MQVAPITFESVHMKNYFARWVYRAAEQYFKDPEVQERFEKWLKERGKTGHETI